MRGLKSWIFLGLIGLLFIEIWLGFPIKLENRESGSGPSLPSAPVDVNEANQKMKGVHLVETRKGERDWELFADAAEGFEGAGKWQIKKVKIHFYSGTEIQYTVTGDSGEVDAERNMKIEGKVKTKTIAGYEFDSPLLLYMAKDRLLLSPGVVEMTAPSDKEGEVLRINADSMRSYVGKSEMNLQGHVVAQKVFNGGKKFSIRSARAEFNGKSTKAQFFDGVSIQYDLMTLESPEASFQYRSNADLLESVQMKGGVKIHDSEKFATADLVRIEPETNQIILMGMPRVVQGQDEIMGDQIVFVDGGKKIRIEKMRAQVEKNNPLKQGPGESGKGK